MLSGSLEAVGMLAPRTSMARQRPCGDDSSAGGEWDDQARCSGALDQSSMLDWSTTFLNGTIPTIQQAADALQAIIHWQALTH